jgi:predicted enzyme related to lactoylglutathione lyase
MGQPVVHFEVVGRDGDKLKAYYAELFGWEFEDTPGALQMNYGLVPREGNTNADGVGIPGGVGGIEGDPRGDVGHVTFYVEVPDVDAALTKAEALGGKRVSGPDEVPGVGIVIGHLSDPEGHVIGLVHPTS